MTPDALRDGLVHLSEKANRERDFFGQAADQIFSLDRLVACLLAEANPNGELTVMAWPGMHRTTCLDLIRRHPGLSFRHNNQTLTVADTTEQL